MKHLYVLLFALSACTQDYAGITRGKATFPCGDPVQMCEAEFTTGKEYGSVTVKAGDFSFSANKVAAFQAQEIRAKVHKAMADAGVKIVPAVVEGIVKALVPVP